MYILCIRIIGIFDQLEYGKIITTNEFVPQQAQDMTIRFERICL